MVITEVQALPAIKNPLIFQGVNRFALWLNRSYNSAKLGQLAESLNELERNKCLFFSWFELLRVSLMCSPGGLWLQWSWVQIPSLTLTMQEPPVCLFPPWWDHCWDFFLNTV